MPVSPQDFALWASATGQKYPSTPGEKAQLTPEVFNFVRNLPKTGLQGAGGVLVERVVYEQPIAVRHEDDNSVFTSPVTPDNHVPKVAGTIGNTMTSDHYEGQQLENQEDKADGTSFARNAAKLALAAGVVAGGIAAARSPAIRGRVSEFLSQFGTPREGVVDTVAASGDVTPQTTAQNYDQEVVAPQTQLQQAVRGATPGTPLKAMDPTTTESTGVKPVTESKVITSTQHFGPDNLNPRIDPWTGEQTPLKTTSEKVQEFTSQFGKGTISDPWETRSGIHARPLFEHSADWREKNPRLGGAADQPYGKFTTRTGTGEFSLHENIRRPPLGGKGLARTIGGPPSETVLVETPLSPYPEQRDVSQFRLGGNVQRLAGARDIEAAIGTYGSQGVFPEGSYSSLVSGEQFEPVSNIWTASSPAETRLVNPGEQPILDKISGYLGGKAAWMEQAKGELEGDRLQRAAQALGHIETLKAEASSLPDPGARAKAETFIKQVVNLYDYTQDPSVLEAAVNKSMPLTLTFPGGQTVETRRFFKPFGATGNEPSVDYPTQRGVTNPVDALESVVIGKQTILGNIKAGILSQFGLKPTDKITGSMFNQLDQNQRKLLVEASNDLKEATAKYERAKDYQILYSIPGEVVESKRVPLISKESGQIVGSALAPEEQTKSTVELYNIRAAGGLGSSDVRTVGRSRERLEADTGGTEFVISPISSTQLGGAMSELESTPFLYRHVDTGELLHPASVTEDMLKSETVRPVRGTAVEAPQILGSGSSSFRGVSTAEIDPRSFDPGEREILAKQFPERVTPEGLIYSEQAMKRPAGYTKPGLGVVSNAFMKRAIERATQPQYSAEQVDENLINAMLKGELQFRRFGKPSQGRYQGEIEAIRRGEQAPGPVNASYHPSTRLKKLQTRSATALEQAHARALMHAAVWGEGLAPSQTVPLESPGTLGPVRTTREFQPQQLSIPGAGLAPQINTTPALEEAVATERYMGTRPGQQLRSAMQKALAKASVRQTSLF